MGAASELGSTTAKSRVFRVAPYRRTFDAHAPTCLPRDVAARGLRVVEL